MSDRLIINTKLGSCIAIKNTEENNFMLDSYSHLVDAYSEMEPIIARLKILDDMGSLRHYNPGIPDISRALKAIKKLEESYE